MKLSLEGYRRQSDEFELFIYRNSHINVKQTKSCHITYEHVDFIYLNVLL